MKPKVLVASSPIAPRHSVMCGVGALYCQEVDVRVIDSGCGKDGWEGAIEHVFRSIVGESPEKRIHNACKDFDPDVTVAFEPATTQVLVNQRDQTRGAPVIAVLPGPHVSKQWAGCGADRFLVVDDRAAVRLEELGIIGERILPVGYFAEHEFFEWAGKPKEAVRKRFSLDGKIVVVEVDGLGFEQTGQLVSQLGLIGNPEFTYLFDAGKDKEAATALRARVPATGLNAKLFGATGNTPAYWRSADVIVARPTQEAVSRANVVGARFVALTPAGEREKRLAAAIAERSHSTQSATFIMLPSAIERVLNKRRGCSRDAASNLADIAWRIGTEKNEVLSERQEEELQAKQSRHEFASAERRQVEKMTAPAGELEDLGSGGGGLFGERPSGGLPRELRVKKEQLESIVADAQRMTEQWQRQAVAARKKNKVELEKRALHNVDSEKARMHAALAELAQLSREIPKEKPSSKKSSRRRGVEDSLRAMKRNKSKSVDDELAALKRKAKK